MTGLAVLIDAGSAATYTTSGAYGVLDTAIVLGDLPQTPDRVITITGYGVSDDPSLSDSVVGVQIRCRAEGQDKRLSDDLADTVFGLLHGMTDTTLSTGVRVVQALRTSYSSLGVDGNARWENSSNYAVTVHRPSAHRT